MLNHSVSLLPFTTFGVQSRAEELFQAEDLHQMIAFLHSRDPKSYIVLGGGSNVLFLHDKVDCVVQMVNQDISVVHEDDEQVLVDVAAGVVWDDWVNYAVERNWYGIENLSAIPGHVGASPVQNIGAYGAEVASTIVSVQYIDRKSLSVNEIENPLCAFGYRDSIFKRSLKDKTIITRVRFALKKQAELLLEYGNVKEHFAESRLISSETDLQLIRSIIVGIRSRKLPDPKLLGNVGSYFKNPIVAQKQALALSKLYPSIPVFPLEDHDRCKLSAAWLIEHVGMKGYRMGRVGVHQNQPLVLVNYGGAGAGEILALENLVHMNVANKFGIHLEAEVNKY